MKEKILNTTAQLISQYGLKKFTVDEIASELRISKKTIQPINIKVDKAFIVYRIVDIAFSNK